MSDYFGRATLEDWLAEEVFAQPYIPKEVVELFEPWRGTIESNIEGWLETDDGQGNHTSWRAWGRGFDTIPITDSDNFESRIARGRQIMREVLS